MMKKYKLKELGDIITGTTPSKSNENYYESEDIAFFKPADLCDTQVINLNESDEYVSVKAENVIRIVPKNSILFTCIGASIGKMGLVNCEKATFNQQINAIVANSIIDSRYFAYALYLNRTKIRDIANAPVIPIINKSRFGEIEIEIHEDKMVQKKVASVLDKAQQLINFRKEQIEACDELIKSQFIEMFGDPIINNKQYETQLGENVFKLSNGKTVPQNKRLNEGIPAYGGNGISYYTEEVLFEKDTIVVGRVGFQSGNVHMVKGPLWITDNAMYISEIFDNGYELEFLYALMEHIDFTRFQDPGDLKKITQKPFMQMEYIKPPLSLQKEYIMFVQHTDKLKFVMQQSLIELENQFNSLMQKAFKGELF